MNFDDERSRVAKEKGEPDSDHVHSVSASVDRLSDGQVSSDHASDEGGKVAHACARVSSPAHSAVRLSAVITGGHTHTHTLFHTPLCHTPSLSFHLSCLAHNFRNRALATVSCTFRRPHLPKVVRTRQFLTIFM